MRTDGIAAQRDAADFAITLLRDLGSTVISVCGELDMATAPRLAEMLECLCRSESGDMDIDVTQMSFCDCTGLSVLLAAAHRRRSHGRRLTLVNPSASLRRLIELTGLDQDIALEPAEAGPTSSPGLRLREA